MTWLLEGALLGIGLLIGVWCFLGLINWLGNIGQDITEEEADQRTRRWMREHEQQDGSRPPKP